MLCKSLVAAGHCVSQSHNCWRFSWTSLKTTGKAPKSLVGSFCQCKLQACGPVTFALDCILGTI